MAHSTCGRCRTWWHTSKAERSLVQLAVVAIGSRPALTGCADSNTVRRLEENGERSGCQRYEKDAQITTANGSRQFHPTENSLTHHIDELESHIREFRLLSRYLASSVDIRRQTFRAGVVVSYIGRTRSFAKTASRDGHTHFLGPVPLPCRPT